MNLELKIIDLLWRNPEKAFTINEIANILKGAYSNVNKIVTRLINDNVILKNVVGHSFQCSLNTDSYKAKALVIFGEVIKREEYMKKYDKLKLLFDDFLKERPSNIISVILFGSYAKETFSKESDIDLLVLMKKKTDISSLVRKIHSLHNKEITPIVFTINEFSKRREEPIIKEIMKNHIIIHGLVEFITEVF